MPSLKNRAKLVINSETSTYFKLINYFAPNESIQGRLTKIRGKAVKAPFKEAPRLRVKLKSRRYLIKSRRCLIKSRRCLLKSRRDLIVFRNNPTDSYQ